MSSRRTSGSHLSPFDLTGVGRGFGLYRPRRPSYTFATQVQRQRSESYRYAVRKSASDSDEPPDFIEGIIQRKTRKESYIRATRQDEEASVELHDVKEAMKRVEDAVSGSNDVTETEIPKLPNSPVILINDKGIDDVQDGARPSSQNSKHKDKAEVRNGKARYSLPEELAKNHIEELKEVVEKKRYSPKLNNRSERLAGQSERMHIDLPAKVYDEECTDDSVFATDGQQNGNSDNEVMTPSSVESSFTSKLRKITMKKNLILLCLSFILIFNAFRAIQNLQSSLNSENNLGIIAMSCVHGTMCLTCLWAPVLINNFTAKWTLVIGMLSFILWIVGNFFPRFYTLVPLGMVAGVGKGILWTAESSYILKLSYDYSRVTREGLEKEMFRFHGIFLACFQTTHIWGNLISSLVLHITKKSYEEMVNADIDDMLYGIDYEGMNTKTCGVLFQCNGNANTSGKYSFLYSIYVLCLSAC